MSHRILLATSNSGKINMFSRLIQSLQVYFPEPIQLFTPQELGISDLEPSEDGLSVSENAYSKAKTYWDALPVENKMPCLAIDIAGYANKLEEQEQQPGLHLRRHNGQKLTDQQAIERYRSLAQNSGGEIQFKFDYALALFAGYTQKINLTSQKFPEKIEINENLGIYPIQGLVEIPQNVASEMVLVSQASIDTLVTTKVVGEVESGMPLSSMWKSLKHGKYQTQMNQKEYEQEFQPLRQALFELIVSLPHEGDLSIGKFQLHMRCRPRSLGIIQEKQDMDNPENSTYKAFIKNYGGSKGQLTWVGGGVDFGEKPLQSLLREIQEELGYTSFRQVKEIKPNVYHFFQGVDYGVTSVTFGFVLEIADWNHKLPAEIDDGRYSLRTITASDFMNESKMDIAKIYLSRLLK